MRNKDVCEKFIIRVPATGSNLISSGTRLYSYNTCIAEWYGNQLIINTTKYSVSTSRHQSYLRHLVDSSKTINNIMKVDDIEMNTNNLKDIIYG